MVTDRYDNLAKASRITIPTLVVHGNQDALVPYDMGVELARAITGAELVTIDGGAHNDLFVRARDRLFAAISQHSAG